MKSFWNSYKKEISTPVLDGFEEGKKKHVALHEEYIFDKNKFNSSKPGIIWGLYNQFSRYQRDDSVWIEDYSHNKTYLYALYSTYMLIFEFNKNDFTNQVGWLKKKSIVDYDKMKELAYSTSDMRNKQILEHKQLNMLVLNLSSLLNKEVIPSINDSSFRKNLHNSGFWQLIDKRFSLQPYSSLMRISALLEDSDENDPLFDDLLSRYSESSALFFEAVEDYSKEAEVFKKNYRQNQHLQFLSQN